MSILSIGFVDNGTDQITIVGHGFLTGDGPVAIYTPNGTLPSPLAGVTDYWVIKVDNDIIKLATSSANALANTPINLTTDGIGTRYLLYGIPYRRARTYNPGAQLKSADLNALMDSHIALWNLLTGQAQSIYTGLPLETKQLDVHGGGSAVTSFSGAIASGDRTSGAAAEVHDIVIDLPVGSVVYGYSVRVKGNGTNDLVHKLVKIADAVETNVSPTITMTAPTATWQSAINNSFSPVTITAGERLVIRFTAGGSGQRVGAPSVDWQRARW